MSAPSSTLASELDAQNERLESASPHDVLTWVFDRFGDDVAMACSFEDLALLHMVHQLRPATPIVFLDTGGHFAETLDFVGRIERDWSLNLTRTTPGPEAEAWPCGTERCCELRKVEPLGRAVEGRAAWITALKRVDAPSRAATRVVAWDDRFHLVKANPLATWTDDDVAYYLRANDLPEHPLWAQGYASIGCAAVTVRPAVPGDRRSGRWVGADQEECGLHGA
jgi:phosphoadenosine phosphosulfate reductase